MGFTTVEFQEVFTDCFEVVVGGEVGREQGREEGRVVVVVSNKRQR